MSQKEGYILVYSKLQELSVEQLELKYIEVETRLKNIQTEEDRSIELFFSLELREELRSRRNLT